VRIVAVPGVRLTLQACNAVLDAAARVPGTIVPAWPWPARPSRRRLVVSIIWAVLAVGWTASAIAELIVGRKVSSILGTLIGMADWTQRDEGDRTTRWLRQVSASFPEVDIVQVATRYSETTHRAQPSFNRFRELVRRTSERRQTTTEPARPVKSARAHDFS